MKRIAYFISPHGYGHASRAAAVMAAIQRRSPDVAFDIYTLVPPVFFENSLEGSFDYFPLLSDIGLVQHDALREDVPATIRQLADMLPFDTVLVRPVARQLCHRKTIFAVCDIAPLGIRIAEEAGLPSILVENFTWDWIYAGYEESHPEIRQYADYLGDCFSRATHHVQTAPVCEHRKADLLTPPVARSARQSREETRARLCIPEGKQAILISMGGFPEQHEFVDRLRDVGAFFVVPGTADTVRHEGNVIELPHHSDFYHPDLVQAVDCVIGKVGYSTIAEVYHSGVPFGYVSRSHFRESPPLAKYIADNIPSMPIAQADFRSGAWLKQLPELLALPRRCPALPNGADTVAEFVLELL